MIRINLLPVRAAKKRESGQQQFVLSLLLVVLEVFVLFMVYNSKADQKDALELSVQQKRAAVSQVQAIDQSIAALQQRKSAAQGVMAMIDDLQRNRIGPAGPLEELKYVLNLWADETEREYQQVQLGWDTSWDPQAVWVSSLDVTPGAFQLRGLALTMDDVAEFLLRLETPLTSDPFFTRPELEPVTATRDGILDSQVMQFSVTGGVRYHPLLVRE